MECSAMTSGDMLAKLREVIGIDTSRSVILWLDDEAKTFWDSKVAHYAWQHLDPARHLLVCLHISPVAYPRFDLMVRTNCKLAINNLIPNPHLRHDDDIRILRGKVSNLVRYQHLWALSSELQAFLLQAASTFNVKAVVYDAMFALADNTGHTEDENVQNGVTLVNAIYDGVQEGGVRQEVLTNFAQLEVVRQKMPCNPTDKNNQQVVERTWREIGRMGGTGDPPHLSFSNQILAIADLSSHTFHVSHPELLDKPTLKHAAKDSPMQVFSQSPHGQPACAICRRFVARALAYLAEVRGCLPKCAFEMSCFDAPSDKIVRSLGDFYLNFILFHNPDWCMLDGFLEHLSSLDDSGMVLNPNEASVAWLTVNEEYHQWEVQPICTKEFSLRSRDGSVHRLISIDNSLWNNRADAGIIKSWSGGYACVVPDHFRTVGRALARNFVEKEKANTSVHISSKPVEKSHLQVTFDFTLGGASPLREKVVAEFERTASPQKLSVVSDLMARYKGYFVVECDDWQYDSRYPDSVELAEQRPGEFSLSLFVPLHDCQKESGFWEAYDLPVAGGRHV